MTPEDVEAFTKALQKMHAAEVHVQKAFIEQRPWEERDEAIKKARQTRYAWNIHWEPSSSRTGRYERKVKRPTP